MPCVKSPPRTWRRKGNALLRIASDPHAATVPSTNPNSIGSTASEVVGATAYRHRVTFAALPFSTLRTGYSKTALASGVLSPGQLAVVARTYPTAGLQTLSLAGSQ